MPINIRMKPGFMYFGKTAGSSEQVVPMPNAAPFTTTYNWQTQQSADGSVVGQQLGRSRSTQEMTWERMDCETWWQLNRWIESNGMSFYVRYFNFNTGVWQNRRFYVDSVSCQPYRPAAEGSEKHGMPLYLRDCTLTVYDMGEVGE